jgi:integrase
VEGAQRAHLRRELSEADSSRQDREALVAHGAERIAFWTVTADLRDDGPSLRPQRQGGSDCPTRRRKDAGLLEGYTWHCNRHTFASRLVMAGVDLLTVQRLGGWRTVGMVTRYAHLAPTIFGRR